MLCSSGFNFTSWILDFVPALVTHAKCESSCSGASPSPSGRGWPEGPGEGRLVKNVAHSGPHLPLQPLPTTANVQTPDHGLRPWLHSFAAIAAEISFRASPA